MDLILVLGAIAAGALTTLAPCVLPLLPVIVGGSVVPPSSESVPEPGTGGVAVRNRSLTGRRRAVIIAASLAVSVLVFTLLLRGSAALLGVPAEVWSWVSGGILIALGAAMLFPSAWDAVSARLGLQRRSAERLQRAASTEGTTGAILTGAALGPVFTSCSPLYAYILVVVLPASPADALVQLVAYVVGLAGALLAIALLGQRLVARLGWAADPHGWLRRTLGAVFIAVGVAVALGWDRDLQEWILEHSPVQPWNLDSGFLPVGA
ncbi:MAG: cytochrome c biogenesis CcdA family protein [Candidatus Nanopelagicales bacterium]